MIVHVNAMSDADNLPQMSSAGIATLSDTVEHAAATALIVAASVCTDPVRSHTERTVYPLIHAAGDGAESRRRAGALSSLVAEVLTFQTPPADMRPGLVLALERWLMHPRLSTADELVGTARYFLGTVSSTDDMALLEHAWLVGDGLDGAVVELREHGLNGDNASQYLSLVASAVELVVPMVWIAKVLGVTRDQLYRRIRPVDRQAWRTLLP